MFQTVSLSIIRSFSLYTQQWYMSYSLRAGSGRNCPKHVHFYSKNKFEKLVHLVRFIIRIYHDARSPERQIHTIPCPHRLHQDSDLKQSMTIHEYCYSHRTYCINQRINRQMQPIKIFISHFFGIPVPSLVIFFRSKEYQPKTLAQVLRRYH